MNKQRNKDKDFLDRQEYFEDDEMEFGEFEDEESELSSIKEPEDEEVCEEDLETEKSKEYWTEQTEDAVIGFLYLNELFYENRIKEEEEEAIKKKRPVNKKYCQEMERRMQEVLKIEDRHSRREKIFRDSIRTPLQKLVENILFNYKLFVPGIDIKTQQRDCYTFLYMKFTNFNPWKRTKSFSYYGTVAKHYYLGKRKDHAKDVKVLLDYESNKEEADSSVVEEMDMFRPQNKSFELFNFIIKSIEKDLIDGILTKNDQKVGDAIVQIFKNHEIIGVYNKNQVYQLIKESTGLETKDITYSLHRFRVSYKILRQEFNDKNK